ncbi:MAG: cohesin domain-containing protein, partial [Bacteroidota bacterium]
EIPRRDFSNVTAFQTDVTFAAGQLTFQSANTNSLLQDPFQVSTPAAGTVRLLYFQNAQSGITVDDGTIIGSLCFTNNSTDATVLSFTDLVVTGTGGQQPNPVGNGGTVNDCMTSTNDPLVLSVGSGMAAVGDQVCVDVDVTDFTNITDLSLSLNYDEDVLMLSSVTANTALPGFGSGNFTTGTAGQIGVSYASATPRTLADGNSLFTVCFTVRTGEETNLTISGATATIGGGTNLPVNTNPGVINLGGQITYDNLSLVAGDGTGAVGTEVCIDFEVFNFTGVSGLQFPVTYDAEVLSFVSATATGALVGLQASNPDPGVVRAIWFDQSINPNTLDDGTSILQVCFNVLSGCETEVKIEDIPRFSIRASNPDNQPIVPFDVFSGTINEGATGTDCGPPPPGNVVLNLANAEGPIGSEVCMDLKVADFTSLTDLSFSLTYDNDVVSFSEVNNFGLSSVTAGDVTNPNPGVLTFDWDAAGGSGQSLPGNATLLSFCFTVDRVATTNVNFSNSPTLIRARNSSGQNIGVVPS